MRSLLRFLSFSFRPGGLRIAPLLFLGLFASNYQVRADWSITRTDHPDHPGEILLIENAGTSVARFVFEGPNPPKPYIELFGTDGEIITQGEFFDNLPAEKGIFTGWSAIDSNLGTHDLWTMTTGSMTVAEIELMEADQDAATFIARIEWVAGDANSGDLLLTEWRYVSISQAFGKTDIDVRHVFLPERDLTLGSYDGPETFDWAGVQFRAHAEVALPPFQTSVLQEPIGETKGRPLKWSQITYPLQSRTYKVSHFNAPSNDVDRLTQRIYGRIGYYFGISLKRREILLNNFLFQISEVDLDQEPIDYQAEDALLGGGNVGGPEIKSIKSGYNGSGYVDFHGSSTVPDGGEYIDWTVDVPVTRTYPIVFRYAHGANNSRAMCLSINGITIEPEFDFNPTGSWTLWLTNEVETLLRSGTNSIRLTSTDESGPNIDELSIDVQGGPLQERQILNSVYDEYVSTVGQNDVDGDGQSTANELIAGTNPLDPTDVFKITESGVDAGGLPFIEFPNRVDRIYRVFRSADLILWIEDSSGTFTEQENDTMRWTGLVPAGNLRVSVERE